MIRLMIAGPEGPSAEAARMCIEAGRLHNDYAFAVECFLTLEPGDQDTAIGQAARAGHMDLANYLVAALSPKPSQLEN